MQKRPAFRDVVHHATSARLTLRQHDYSPSLDHSTRWLNNGFPTPRGPIGARYVCRTIAKAEICWAFAVRLDALLEFELKYWNHEVPLSLVGNGLRHAWQKDCWRRAVAVHHARQVARECARDEHYRGVVIEVLDSEGKRSTWCRCPINRDQNGQQRVASVSHDCTLPKRRDEGSLSHSLSGGGLVNFAPVRQMRGPERLRGPLYWTAAWALPRGPFRGSRGRSKTSKAAIDFGSRKS